MANTKTVHVPHLGGIDVGYQMPHPYNSMKPTLILINSFTTSAELYHSQFENDKLTRQMNLIAIEPLGHGKTRSKAENFTYWDSAVMNLQVMEVLGIKKAFVLGTSQGGWITVRMALLGPSKIEGIIPLGTSMDYESERTRNLGCWNGIEAITPSVTNWTTTSTTPDFTPDTAYCDFLIDIGFGYDCSEEVREFWRTTIKENYRGDDGRRRVRMAGINLRERDGLHGRLFDVRCPVLWMHGTKDVVFSVRNAEEEIKLFVNARVAELRIVEGGRHFLSASHPAEIGQALVGFIGEWADKYI